MAKYFIGKSDSGKTRKMLEEAEKNKAVVICKYPKAMQIKAYEYGLRGIEFAGYDEIGIVLGDKIVIDEIGDFFSSYFGVDLDSFTMTDKTL